MVSERKKIYMKEYHRTHRKQKAESDRRYREKHREKIRSYQHEWYKKNLEKMREYFRNYRRKRYASDENFREKTLERSHKRYRKLREQVLKIQKFYTEDFIFGYIIKNMSKLGFHDVIPYRNKNFDFFGVREDGTVERVEIERSAGRFLSSPHHDATKLDRVIAVFGSERALPIPVTLIDKKEYRQWINELPIIEVRNRR